MSNKTQGLADTKKRPTNEGTAEKPTDARASDDSTSVSSSKRSQVNLRCQLAEKELWEAAAGRLGLGLSEYMREVLNGDADRIVNCAHGHKREYPWRVTCLDCGEVLFDDGSRF